MKVLRVGFIFLGLALTGCSQHWRDADPGIDSAEVDALLTESLQAVTAQASIIPQEDAERFQALVADPNTTIYFAESNAEMGEPKNLVPFLDWRFLGD